MYLTVYSPTDKSSHELNNIALWAAVAVDFVTEYKMATGLQSADNKLKDCSPTINSKYKMERSFNVSKTSFQVERNARLNRTSYYDYDNTMLYLVDIYAVNSISTGLL